MPAVRLTDSQKAELVERFRAGQGPQPLAEAYGCSPNTVSRVVKAALEPAEYARLRDQRGRRSVAEPAAVVVDHGILPTDALALDPEPPAPAAAALAAAAPVAAAPALTAQDPAAAGNPSTGDRQPRPVVPPPRRVRAAAESEGEDGPAVLAIDDADDFGDDEDDDDLLADDDGGDEAASFVPVPLVELVDDHTEIRAQPLTSADLPGSAYMLVDKTVELQARPLSEFSELGRLSADEQHRQALMVFVNPRQAKRLCGRSQRVIKLPDTAVLSRTAPYLLAQGISRVVIEGALFALPGS
jgi:hypothetical protein